MTPPIVPVLVARTRLTGKSANWRTSVWGSARHDYSRAVVKGGVGYLVSAPLRPAYYHIDFTIDFTVAVRAQARRQCRLRRRGAAGICGLRPVLRNRDALVLIFGVCRGNLGFGRTAAVDRLEAEQQHQRRQQRDQRDGLQAPQGARIGTGAIHAGDW
jgi:hypothetical protein